MTTVNENLDHVYSVTRRLFINTSPFVSVSALLVQERNVSQFYKEWEIQLLRIVSGDRSYQGRWQVSQLQISDKSQIN